MLHSDTQTWLAPWESTIVALPKVLATYTMPLQEIIEFSFSQLVSFYIQNIGFPTNTFLFIVGLFDGDIYYVQESNWEECVSFRLGHNEHDAE